MNIRVNIGCGTSPTANWRNYDNSLSVRLARWRPVILLLRIAGMLRREQLEFIEFASRSDIRYADAIRRIPELDGSVEVVYCSHMLEHLDTADVGKFLAEAKRVLRVGGILRIAVPSLRYHVQNYLSHGDANAFMRGTLLGKERPKTIAARIQFFWVGDRLHHWMYDGDSLCRLLMGNGFACAEVMPAGKTKIENPGDLNLQELSPESVFVEAVNQR